MKTKLALGVLALAATACADGGVSGAASDAVSYGPIETRLLDRDLVSFSTTVRGAQSAEDIRAVTDCAAAEYTLIRGYNYARHIRTTLDTSGAVWAVDAAYTISVDLPRGDQTVDAVETLAACRVLGLPTF